MSSYRVSISYINMQAREMLNVISNLYDTLMLWITQLILYEHIIFLE